MNAHVAKREEAKHSQLCTFHHCLSGSWNGAKQQQLTSRPLSVKVNRRIQTPFSDPFVKRRRSLDQPLGDDKIRLFSSRVMRPGEKGNGAKCNMLIASELQNKRVIFARPSRDLHGAVQCWEEPLVWCDVVSLPLRLSLSLFLIPFLRSLFCGFFLVSFRMFVVLYIFIIVFCFHLPPKHQLNSRTDTDVPLGCV